MRDYFDDRFIDYLDEYGPVKIAGHTWVSSQVYKKMPDTDYEAALDEWVESQIVSARDRVKDFLSDLGCLERFNQLAEIHLRHNVDALGRRWYECCFWSTYVARFLGSSVLRVPCPPRQSCAIM